MKDFIKNSDNPFFINNDLYAKVSNVQDSVKQQQNIMQELEVKLENLQKQGQEINERSNFLQDVLNERKEED